MSVNKATARVLAASPPIKKSDEAPEKTRQNENMKI
jgi:hypothetical protein